MLKNVIDWVILIGSCITALGVITAFLQRRQKKALQNIFKSEVFEKEFKYLNEQINSLNGRIDKLNERINKIDNKIDGESIRSCRMYLVDFLNDIENGVTKDSVQKQLAYEVFEYYSNELHCNSYVHDKWIKVMENRKDLVV